jgi:site-specific DNA-methyltransferase (adenine-specific)
VKIKNGEFLLGDCLELMRDIPDGSVDMVLCDLPYGTTACSWDSVIPFEPLWEQYWRVCKPNAAVVLTAAQPFTTALISSQMKYFKYEWIWSKNLPSGHANANRQPMRSHENVCVFYKGQPTYNKQPTESKIKDRKLGGSNGIRGKAKTGGVYGEIRSLSEEITLRSNVSPRSVLEIPCVPRATGTIHPTQKPVALFEYLIRTYTNPGEHVLDNTAGSGTTAIAAENTGRRWTCIERDEDYYIKAVARVLDNPGNPT